MPQKTNNQHRSKKMLIFGGWLAALAALAALAILLGQTHHARIAGPVLPSAAPVDTAQSTVPGPSGVPAPATAEDWWSEVLRNAPAPPRGSPNAPFTIVEIGDFQCPQCGKVRPAIQEVVDRGGANLYFIQFPIAKEHKYALIAAEAADSAADQGKFWEMYDTLYKHQSDLSLPKLKEYANAIGIDGSRVESDVKSKRYAAQIAASLDLCAKLKVAGTPSVIVRNNVHGGYRTGAGGEVYRLMAGMKKALDRAATRTLFH